MSLDANQQNPVTPSLQGLDLKVGGEFHKKLYDQKIPSFMKKYTAKWGGKVGETVLPDAGTSEMVYTGKELSLDEVLAAYQKARAADSHVNVTSMEALRQLGVDMKRGIPFKDAANALTPAAAQYLGGDMEKTPAKVKVHSIEITPQMRHSLITEPQPIAKNRPPLPAWVSGAQDSLSA